MYQVTKGVRFGRLTLVRYAKTNSHRERYFEVKCDCGQITTVSLGRLRHGATRSCGCLRHEMLLARNNGKRNTSYRHGYHQHALYQVWQNFKQRCLNPEHCQYRNYGKRGITVCKKWLNNPERFVEWGIANGWKKGLLIDRRNNDGNYTPSNCRFVTPKVSANNKRPKNQWSA